MRTEPRRERDHRIGGGELEIERGARLRDQSLDVGILDVAAILAEVRGDPIGAGVLADTGGAHGIRIDGTACLPHRRHMIDVDVEALAGHLPREVLSQGSAWCVDS